MGSLLALLDGLGRVDLLGRILEPLTHRCRLGGRPYRAELGLVWRETHGSGARDNIVGRMLREEGRTELEEDGLGQVVVGHRYITVRVGCLGVWLPLVVWRRAFRLRLFGAKHSPLSRQFRDGQDPNTGMS